MKTANTNNGCNNDCAHCEEWIFCEECNCSDNKISVVYPAVPSSGGKYPPKHPHTSPPIGASER